MQINSALDTVIAIVVILLVLSLIVQSIQTALKKLLKIKSRQIEDSLVDLFETVLNQPPAKLTGRFALIRSASPVLRAIFGRPTAAAPSVPPPPLQSPPASEAPKAQALTAEVVKRFKEIGRVAQSGKPMLESLTKGDLLQVIEKIAPGDLVQDLTVEVNEALKAYDSLCAVLDDVKLLSNNLSGDSSATLAQMQQLLAPLLNDLGSLKSVDAGVLVGDLLRLREIKLDDVLKLLGELQTKVEADLKSAPAPSIPGLTALAEALKKVAALLSALREKLDRAIAPIKGKLDQVGTWFDTVMMSFEERYNRGMKTWAVVIGFVLVILLNADFFKICQTLSHNEVARSKIVSYGEQLVRKKDEQNKTASDLEDSAAKKAAAEAEGRAADAAALQKQVDSHSKKTGEITKTIQELEASTKAETDAYSSFGFDRLHWSDVRQWWSGWCTDNTADKIKRDILGLIGWLITALLLSVGAPFWQDTLESLFGVKNLLRKKGGKNGGDGSNDQSGDQ